MSWSASAVGKASAVRTEIARQFATSTKCTEPEEGVRQAAITLIDVCLAAQDAGAVLKVAASGSQWTDREKRLRNALSINVESLGDFFE